jgi:hypothetical protein
MKMARPRVQSQSLQSAHRRGAEVAAHFGQARELRSRDGDTAQLFPEAQ